MYLVAELNSWLLSRSIRSHTTVYDQFGACHVF